MTSGKAVRATAAAVGRRDCHETAVFRKAFAPSGQTALTAFGDTCWFMLKPRNNSLLQKEDLQRTRKEKKDRQCNFLLFKFGCSSKIVCHLLHISHCNGHFIFIPFFCSIGVSELRLKPCYIASMSEMIGAAVLSR